MTAQIVPMQMRIAIFTIGSRGDVQPYVALGAALQARGHRVTIVTGEGFDKLIASAGLAYGKIDVDFQALISDPDMKAALRSLPALVRAIRGSGQLVERTFRDSWNAADGANVIIYHPKLLAAPHIAERLGCPAILATVVPMAVPTDAFESPLLPIRSFGKLPNLLGHKLVILAAKRGFSGRVQTFRRDALGLTKNDQKPTNILQVAGMPVPRITGVSRALVPMPVDTADTFTTGYWYTGSDRTFTPDPELDRFIHSGPPPIYFGFGSMAGSDPAQTAREVIEALKSTGQRGILARGWGGLQADETPRHVRMIDEAPHSWLFPRCAAVVHHGGAGTTHEGLRWGRPTLIRPVFGDQAFWGRRVAASGAGPNPLSEKCFGGGQLVEALRALGHDSIRQAAKAVAKRMVAEPGVNGAAALIERLSIGK